MAVCDFRFCHFLPLNLLETELQLKCCFKKPTYLVVVKKLFVFFCTAGKDSYLHHLAYVSMSVSIRLVKINGWRCAVDASLQLFFRYLKKLFSVGGSLQLLPSALELVQCISGNKVVNSILHVLLWYRKWKLRFHTCTYLFAHLFFPSIGVSSEILLRAQIFPSALATLLMNRFVE